MSWSKKEKSIQWLHISDFHVEDRDRYDRDVVLRAFLNSLPDLTDRFGKPDLIFSTGDIAYSGKETEYARATEFFDALLGILDLDRTRLIIVPGNHDVDRLAGKGLTRTMQSRDEADEYFDPCSPCLHLEHRQRAFRSWFDSYFEGIRSSPDNSTCATPEIFDINGVAVQVLPINTATFAFDDSDHAKLFVGRRCLNGQLEEARKIDADLKIAVMHHPLSWLSPLESTNIKTSLREYVDVVLLGHLHENDVEYTWGLGDGVLSLAAGATYQTRTWPNTAMFCKFSAKTVHIAPVRYSDSPREAWVADTCIFPNEPNYVGSVSLGADPSPKVDFERGDAPPTSLGGNDILETETGSASSQSKSDFEKDLFLSPLGTILYAEPRLMRQDAEFVPGQAGPGERVSIDELINSSESFIVETRPEYGGTTLCRRLAYEFASRKMVALARDARQLPPYKAKFEREFPASIRTGQQTAILVLDNFDLERDERLLKELHKTEWFSRVVIITINRSLLSVRPIDETGLPFEPKRIFLWAMARDDIRQLSSSLFASTDDVFVSRVVDKVYDDLLALCIPLTPSNVVMYLRVLYKEGDFHPLNRVDIVGRYIYETLRRPSDAYADSFSAKGKADILSSFVYHLYKTAASQFDDRVWFDFCTEYQKSTLTDFDAREFLEELIESRVFGRYGRQIYLKYSFFYTFFLGRYISSRQELIDTFIGNYILYLASIAGDKAPNREQERERQSNRPHLPQRSQGLEAHRSFALA